MVRRVPPLLRFAPLALLVAVGSCSHSPTAPPRATLREREATCAPVWKAAHADIEARGATCTADWECQQIRPEYLGCEAWASSKFSLGEARLIQLENACAPISFVPECRDVAGTCTDGRCGGRKAVRDKLTCQAKADEFSARLGEPVTCTSNSDCSAAWVKDMWQVAPTGWRVQYGKEWAALSEACGRKPFADDAGYSPTRSRCEQGTCALLQKDQVVGPRFRKPIELEKGCVGRSVQLPSSVFAPSPGLLFKFRVSKRGVPHSFELADAPKVTPPGYERMEANRKAILVALAEAVSQCAFEPAQVDDMAIDTYVVIPIRFASR